MLIHLKINHISYWTSVYCTMEKKRASILSVKRNEILISVKKKSLPKFMYGILVIVVLTLVFSMSSGDIRAIGIGMSHIYNPVSSLYNDNSDVIFTSGNLSGENLNFYVPIVGNYEILKDGTIVFTVANSIMVKAPEAGVISDVGITNNGIKYIKIKHSESVWSLIENVDIVGVKENEIVSRGKDIATAKMGEQVCFQLFQNNVKINSVKIESTKIVWEA